MARVTRHNVKLKKRQKVHPNHYPERNLEIAKMYKQWTPVHKIAEEYGMTRQRVYQILSNFVDD